MRRFIVLVLLVKYGIAASLAGPSPAARDLMNQIAYQCAEMKELEFPRPETEYDSDEVDFNLKVKMLEGALEHLRKEDASAIDSPALVHDKPFNAQVRAALTIVAANQKRLEADKAAKPNPKALSHVDFAINMAKGAVKSRGEPDEWAGIYEMYNKELKDAASIDTRALDKRRKELAEVEESFVKKYLAKQAALEEQQAATIAKEAAANAAAAERSEEAWRKMKAEAESLGYKDAQVGIAALLEQLQDGTTSLAEAKSTLIYHDQEDDFRVQSVVDRYAIYSFQVHRRDLVQVAVVREMGAFYGEGTQLAVASYAVVGTHQFQTVLGAEKEIVVLKRVR